MSSEQPKQQQEQSKSRLPTVKITSEQASLTSKKSKEPVGMPIITAEDLNSDKGNFATNLAKRSFSDSYSKPTLDMLVFDEIRPSQSSSVELYLSFDKEGKPIERYEINNISNFKIQELEKRNAALVNAIDIQSLKFGPILSEVESKVEPAQTINISAETTKYSEEDNSEFNKRGSKDSKLHITNGSNQTATDRDFRGYTFRKISFENSDLSCSSFECCSLILCNFSQAKVREVDFIRANLEYSNFMEADLTGACLDGANLQSAKLLQACLRGAKLRRSDLNCVDFRQADLQDTFCSESIFRGANLKGANLKGADLRGADLTGVKYDKYTNFEGAIADYRTKFDKKKRGEDVLTKEIFIKRRGRYISNNPLVKMANYASKKGSQVSNNVSNFFKNLFGK